MQNILSRLKRYAVPVALCVVGVTIAQWQWLQPGIPSGHDIGFHMTRMQLFLRALHEGQFPVRWLEWQQPGLSHPLFNFYPPGFYYFTSLIAALGLSYVAAMKVSVFLCGVLSWTGIFIWMKRWFTPVTAMTAAMLWLFAPYRLTQLWVRASFPEYLAISFIPWLFVGIDYVVDRRWETGVPLLTLMTAGVIVTHQPTLMMFLPLLLVWASWRVWQHGTMRSIGWFVLSGALAVGLSCFFWLPLIVEQPFIKPELLRSDYFSYLQHFATLRQLLWSAWGHGISTAGDQDQMSFQLGIVPWLSVLVVSIVVIWPPLRRHFRRSQLAVIGLGLGAVAFGVLMSTAFFEVFWTRLGVLSFLQYPWRYLGVATWGATMLVGGLDLLPGVVGVVTAPAKKKPTKADHEEAVTSLVLMGAVSCMLVVAAILLTWNYRIPVRQLAENTFQLDRPELHDEFFASNPLFGVERGYLPKWVSEVETQDPPERVRVIEGSSQIEIKEWAMTRQTFVINGVLDATVRVATHYYPGWRVWVSPILTTTVGPRQEILPSYDNTFGMMELKIPLGKQHVTLELTETPIRWWANTISLLTAVVCVLGISGVTFWRRRLRVTP